MRWDEGAFGISRWALGAALAMGTLCSPAFATGQLALGGPGSHSSEGTENPGKLADGVTAPTGTADFSYDGSVPGAANQGTLTLVIENTSEPGGVDCGGGRITGNPVITQFNWNTGADITAMSFTSAIDADGANVTSRFDFFFTNPKNRFADGFGKYNCEIKVDNPYGITSNAPAAFAGSQIKSPVTFTFNVTGPEASIDDCTFTTHTTASQNCGCPTVFIAHFQRGGCDCAFSAWISEGEEEICPPPTIDCPDDITAECTSPAGAAVTFTVTAASECDPSVDIDCNYESGSTFPLGTTEVCCTATDDEGQTAACCFNVTVVDTTPPTIDCPDDMTVECTSANGAVVTFTVTASDLCDTEVEVVCTPASGSQFPFGTTEVCCVATDCSDNTITCCFDVTIVDTTPPTIDCPDDMTVECTSELGAIVTYTVTATDTCDSAPIVECVPASGSQFPFGTTQVCCTARDDQGLTATCCFNVTVVDTTPPTIDCPDDMTVECTSENGAVVVYTVTATDNCDPAPRIDCVPASGSQFPFGTTQVCCTATDDSGLTATCCFDVTVVDTTPPTIDCPDDVTVECTGPDGAIVVFTVTATDNCDPAPAIDCVPASGSRFPIGTTEVCCTATDDSGLTSTCCFDVIVHDSAPPTIDCPGDITAECTGPDGAPVVFTVTASDNCDDDVAIDCTFESGSTFPFGDTEVCCTATDDTGLTATCCFTVTVVDTVPPVIDCPEDITVETSDVAVPVEFEVTAEDVCDPNPRIQCDPPSGSSFPAGCSLVVCTATDDSGNVSVCDFEVCVFPCVNFDEDINGLIPEFTFISNQYQPLGVLVSGQSDIGPEGAIARRTGPPGSSTDDVFPTTGLNYLQTFSGGTDSDSGVITFDFVDPVSGVPSSAKFVRLTFLDIEGSGTGPGGTGRTKLQGYDKDGVLVSQVNVPVGPNGGQFVAQIGNPGGPFKIAKAVVTLGNPDPGGESGGIDELCFELNPPTLTTRILGPGPEFHAGDTAPFLVFVKNNKDRTVNADLILRATAKKTKYGRVFSGPTPHSMPAFFDNLAAPELHTLRIPSTKPAIWGRKVFFYADWIDSRSATKIADCSTSFTVMPPN